MFDTIYKCDSPFAKVCRYYMGNNLVPFTCSHELEDKMRKTNIQEMIENQQAYSRGYLKGKQEAYEETRYTRFMSMTEQEKFLKRFNECLKPLEELKRDLELGKF